MLKRYKGFELKAYREKCLGGWEMNYFYAMRISDGWFFIDSFSDSNDTPKDFIEDMKNTIDDYLINPQDYEEEF